MSEEPEYEGDQIMKLIVANFGSLVLLAVAAFCLFGFLATFEPTDKTTQFMMFRIGYGVVGLGCLSPSGARVLSREISILRNPRNACKKIVKALPTSPRL